MKKILMLLVVVIVGFGFTSSVFARTCKYNKIAKDPDTNIYYGGYVDKYPRVKCKLSNIFKGCQEYHECSISDFENNVRDDDENCFHAQSDSYKNPYLELRDDGGGKFTFDEGSKKWSSVDDNTENFLINKKCSKYVVVKFNAHGLTAFKHSAAENFMDAAKAKFKYYLDAVDQANYLFILEVDPSSNTVKEENGPSEQKYYSCADYTKEGESSCVSNDLFSCLWVTKKMGGKTYNYCNFDDLTYVKCGDSWDIPSRIPGIVSFAVNLLKIAVPIILIIVSVITLIKAVTSQKEDEIKKAQNSLIRKLISAAIVFFIIQITQFVIFKVADSSETDNISTCMSCLLNNDCSKNAYYKVNDPEAKLQGKNYKCKFISSGNEEICN